jgi:hypothetical protein
MATARPASHPLVAEFPPEVRRMDGGEHPRGRLKIANFMVWMNFPRTGV